MDQTTLFSREEQSGSGQTNMLALIETNEARISELKTLPHVFHSDCGHGWLQVSYQDLIVLDLLGVISGYSYRKGDKVYLEEDSDQICYLKALFGDFTCNEYIYWRDNCVTEQYQENIFIRNLNSYR